MLRRGITLAALFVAGCPSDPPLSVFPPSVEELEGPTRRPPPAQHVARPRPTPPTEPRPAEPEPGAEGEAIGDPTTAPPAAAAPTATPVLVVAKLVDPGKKAPDCGFVKTSAAMRFTLVNATATATDAGAAPVPGDVYVDVECPELATWKTGTTYRLLVLPHAPTRAEGGEEVVGISNRYTLVRREK